MKIDCWFKVPNGYKYLVLDISEKENDRIFYEKLKLKLLVENEHIRTDIETIFAKYPNKVFSLSRPSVEDAIDNEKVKKLANARNKNIESIAKLNNLLQYDDYIICERCNSLMYKTPLNVGYVRVGNKFIIDSDENHGSVKNVYICSNDDCFCSIDEELFTQLQNNKRTKDELFSQGIRFVPDKFGFYHNAGDAEYNEWKEKNFF